MQQDDLPIIMNSGEDRGSSSLLFFLKPRDMEGGLLKVTNTVHTLVP